MPAKKIQEETYEVIKNYLISETQKDSAKKPRKVLSDKHKQILDRWNYADDLMRKYPVKSHVINMMKKKFNKLSTAQAYKDITQAQRLFNTTTPINKEWIKTWVVDELFKVAAVAKGIPVDEGVFMVQNENGEEEETQIVIQLKDPNLKQWNTALASLIKVLRLDQDDQKELSPEIFEQQNLFITINLSGKPMKIDLQEMLKIPAVQRKKLTDMLIDQEITDIEAEEIMDS